MPAKNAIVGIVIAGGRSTRFGGEKAVAPFAGSPLLLWATRRLATVCERVAVNCRAGTQTEQLAREHGLQVLHDIAGDPDGPLAGVKVGLHWARELGATQLAVSPCDAPLLPAALFDRLAEAAGEGAALAQTEEGRQPLCAIWPVTALDAVTAALAGGQHPATWRLLQSLGAVSVPFDVAQDFANLNTREDLQRLEARLTSGGSPQ